MKKSLLIFAFFLLAGIQFSCAPDSIEDPFAQGTSDNPHTDPSYNSSSSAWRPPGWSSSGGGNSSSWRPYSSSSLNQTTRYFCNGNEYDPATQFCQSGRNIILPLCGTQAYEFSQFCSGTSVYNKCTGMSGREYDPSNQTCQNNVVVTRCGTGNVYPNPATEQCCGNSKYTTATQFCESGNVVKDLCGGQTYTSLQFCCNTAIGTTSTEFCQDYYTLKPLCNGQTYTAAEFCQGTMVKPLCGNKTYEATEQCLSGVVVNAQCGTSWYHSSTHFCQDDAMVKPLCGGQTYLATEQCCGNSKYTSATTHYCKNNLTLVEYGSVQDESDISYKTVVIGTQTWMAENLNFNAEGSRCHGDNTGGDSQNRCDTYGRLYNWATAMGFDASCNSTSCSSSINPKHRGICPEGWHIPSNAEWNQLYHYADGTANTSSNYDSPTAGRYLKATSGWNSNGNGQDTYGFAALPGGLGYSGGGFSSVGNYGRWWSASEYDSNYAYDRYMDYSNEGAIWYNYYKYYLYSVRCAQD
jgi:uncharacterized protein (TIGR02145 family)